MAMARSSGVVVVTSPPLAAELPPEAPPKAPNSTLVRVRFIASVMSLVRIRPEAPTRAPPMMSAEFEMTKPVAAAAMPERELSRAMTTGMSAPPIGITARTPSVRAIPPTTQNQVISWVETMSTDAVMRPAPRRALKVFCPKYVAGEPPIRPWSLA